jgi:hypothetical protein
VLNFFRAASSRKKNSSAASFSATQYSSHLYGGYFTPGDRPSKLQSPKYVEPLIKRMQARDRRENPSLLFRRLEADLEETAPLVNFFRKRQSLIDIDGDRPIAKVALFIQESLRLSVMI